MRAIQKIKFLSLLVPILFLAACDDEGDDKLYDNKVSLESLTVGYSNTGQNLYIESARSWEITYELTGDKSEENWFTLPRNHGSGDDALKLTYTVNTGERRGVKFNVDFGNEMISVELTQLASGNEPDDPDPDDPDPDDPDPDDPDPDDPDPQGPVTYQWMELPLVETSDELLFVEHHTPLGGKMVRNYSFLYDIETYIAYWVAFPLHKSYLEGSGENKTWYENPNVPSQYQTRLKSGYGNYEELQYDRGHQIASADRTTTVEMNKQTYYYTNSTPQKRQLNGQRWMRLEAHLQSMAKNTTDTLWVVTGAILQTVGGNEDINYITNVNDNKVIPVPNYYYKVVLKPKNDSFTAVGFWMENAPLSGTVTSADAKTVKEIEEKTGYTFFNNLPEEQAQRIKSDLVVSDWFTK